MKNSFFVLVLFLIVLITVNQAVTSKSNLKLNKKVFKDYSTIPFIIENKEFPNKPLNIIIPQEVITSFICREIETKCFLQEQFLKKKIFSKQKITENKFNINDLSKDLLINANISKDSNNGPQSKLTFSVPEIYYSECKFYYDYYNEDLISQVKLFFRNKITSNTDLLSRFKTLQIEFSTKESLFMVYFILDKLKFSERITNSEVDIILLKSEKNEFYLYRIITSERLSFKINNSSNKNIMSDLNDVIKQNNRYYIFSFIEKIKKFILRTKGDDIQYKEVVEFKQSKNESSKYTSNYKSSIVGDIRNINKNNLYFCNQNIFSFYNKENDSMNYRSLLSVYYFDLIIDFDINIKHKSVKLLFPEITIMFSLDTKRIKSNDSKTQIEESFIDELNRNPQLEKGSLLSIINNSDKASIYDIKSIKQFNSIRLDENKIPEIKANFSLNKDFKFKNPRFKETSSNKSKLKRRLNKSKFDPGEFVINKDIFFNSTKYLEESINEDLDIEIKKDPINENDKKEITINRDNFIHLQVNKQNFNNDDLVNNDLIQLE